MPLHRSLRLASSTILLSTAQSSFLSPCRHTFSPPSGPSGSRGEASQHVTISAVLASFSSTLLILVPDGTPLVAAGEAAILQVPTEFPLPRNASFDLNHQVTALGSVWGSAGRLVDCGAFRNLRHCVTRDEPFDGNSGCCPAHSSSNLCYVTSFRMFAMFIDGPQFF